MEQRKGQLDKIDALYEEYNHTKDPAKRKVIYKKIDSVSGVASKYAIANEYDKMMTAMGAQGTNAFTSFEKTVYTDDVQQMLSISILLYNLNVFAILCFVFSIPN